MFDTIKLDNGATVVMEKIDTVRSVAIGIFVKNGSINEDEKTNGISHFIEHMLFKGTKTKTARDIAEEMDNIGGQLNAFTSKEYTCYYARVLDEHIDKAVDMLLDMLLNSKFDEEDIKKEAKVILEEIDMYEDSPDDIVFSKLHQKMWQNKPIGNTVLGTKDNISRFKREDFLRYMQKKYVAENIVVAIAGNFDKDLTLGKIKASLEKLPKGDKNTEADLVYDCVKSNVKIAKDIEQLHLCLAFNGISLKSKYNYTMSLFNTIFGGGISSILFQKVREENGLAYSIYSYNSSYVNNGLFNIYVGLNRTQIAKTMDIIRKEIKELKKMGISDAQILKTKEQLKSNYIMGLESTSNIMSSLGRSKLLLDTIKTPTQIIEEVDKIKKEDIDYIIQNVLDIDKMSISIVGRVDDIDVDNI